MSHSAANYRHARTPNGEVISRRLTINVSNIPFPSSTRKRPQLKEYRFYDPADGTRNSQDVTLVTTSTTGEMVESRMHCEERPIRDHISTSPHQGHYGHPHPSPATASPLSPKSSYTGTAEFDYCMHAGLSPPPMTSPAPSPSILSASLRRDSSSSAGRSTGSRHATPVPLSRTVSRSGSVSDWEVMYELGLPRPGTIDYAYSPATSPLSPSYGFASAPSPQSTTRKAGVASSSGSRSRHGSPAPSYHGAPSPAASVRSPLGR
ncbi:hypothetical protein BT96DRAFT_918577 [Gymnopus androsaceus JB14]|uniref:Uncharacterized protein n=1 Tax=Gymnopus androsaceus JB14 TaxID=1447944 RepID=A0A6A4HRS2_9AGAR|nr:hypothetical protein BT96DRAFT_918577 [Gymnopus androsaceus JB14]